MEEVFHVYILQSLSSGRFYIGSTADLADRLKRHQEDRSASTKGRGPWKLIYKEIFPSRSEAVKRELEIKGWKSHRRVQQLIGREHNA